MVRQSLAAILVIVAFTSRASAQNLTNGDVAIVNFATEPNGMVGLMALTNLPAGAALNMTVASWSNGFDSTANYRWQVPASGVPAGTFVTVTNFNTAALSVSTGTIALGPIQMGLSAPGDQILLFQTNASSTWFVYAFNHRGPWLTNGPISNTDSYEPPGVAGASMVLPASTNAAFNRNLTNGTKAELLAAITNPANWIKSSFPFTFTNLPMTVTNPQVATVTFSTSTAPDVAESGPALAVRVNSSADIARTAVVASVGSAALGSDFGLSATQFVFGGGVTSHVLTITPTDDAIAESNETIALTLIAQPGTVLGANPIFTATLLDNEIKAFFATNAGFATEGDVPFRVNVQRSGDAATSSVYVTFGGDAELGVDYDAFTWTHIRNPSKGSGKLGEAIDAWGTNLVAVGAIEWGAGGAVILYDGMGNTLTTITNPTPDGGDVSQPERFGKAVAFVRSDLLLVGAEGDNIVSNDAGGAHLFSWNGTTATHLATFTDPQPSFRDYFGAAVAGISSNRFLVGAFNSDVVSNDTGAVYLHEWNGSTLGTLSVITNPSPNFGDTFGRSIAVLASNRFVIGNEFDDTSIVNGGLVTVHGWNGGAPTLLGTITNPSPDGTDQFGHALATMGTNLILITADRDTETVTNAGAAYVYGWSGSTAALLATILNPTPGAVDNFGDSISTLGTNLVVIGAPRDDTGATNAGSVYLYEWNGTTANLLATITNPAPAVDDLFGDGVRGISSNRFVVGAPQDDLGVVDTGAAYVYEWTGSAVILVDTLNTDSPGNNDSFGDSVAAIGTNRIIIGASSDSGPAQSAGAFHAFDWTGTGLIHVATVTNPVARGSLFARALDNLGNARLIVSAPNDSTDTIGAGRAYLYSATGGTFALLATITNPAPSNSYTFASAVSGFGANRFLIGSPNESRSGIAAGVMYLYDWDGTNASVSATITNPSPVDGESFGASVDNLGVARFVIGCPYDFNGTHNAGSAYLYQLIGTNVSLLATVTNPAPEGGDAFGATVTGISSTRFAVGAPNDSPDGFLPSGSVFVYEWDGSSANLLGMITNPAPGAGDAFGQSIVAPSANRLIVGAYQDTGDHLYEGLAYSYEWNGSTFVLRSTLAYPGPNPGPSKSFATAMAVVDQLGLVITSPGDSDVGSSSGSAWLLRTAKSGQPLYVEFDDGQTNAFVQVVLLDDSIPEPTNSLTLALFSALGAIPFGTTSSVYAIADNDPWAYAVTRPTILSSTNAGITWSAMVSGTTYTLQSTTNLVDGPWTTTSVFVATGSTHTVPFPTPTNRSVEAFRLSW